MSKDERPRQIFRDPRFLQFIELFNTEQFFEAHEILEELWLELKGDQKRFVQGLIQFAVAFAHSRRNNPKGAFQVGMRALEAVRTHIGESEGIEITQLIQECEDFLSGKRSDFPKIRTRID